MRETSRRAEGREPRPTGGCGVAGLPAAAGQQPADSAMIDPRAPGATGAAIAAARHSIAALQREWFCREPATLLRHPALEIGSAGRPKIEIGVEVPAEAFDVQQRFLQQYELRLDFN